MPRIPGPLDVVAALQAQAEALASLPSIIMSLTRAVRALAEATAASAETAQSLRRLVTRVEKIVDEMEAPVRALAPGMTRLAKVLDNPVMDTVPATLEEITAHVLPVVRGLQDTQAGIAAIATSTERITRIVDEAQDRIAGLPGASLLRGIGLSPRPKPGRPTPAASDVADDEERDEPT